MDGKELVRRIFDEIINKGKLDAADELMAEDFLDHGPMEDVQGREAFKQLVGQYQAAVSDLHCEVEHLIQEGDTLGWVVRTTGTHTGDQLGAVRGRHPRRHVARELAGAPAGRKGHAAADRVQEDVAHAGSGEVDEQAAAVDDLLVARADVAVHQAEERSRRHDAGDDIVELVRRCRERDPVVTNRREEPRRQVFGGDDTLPAGWSQLRPSSAVLLGPAHRRCVHPPERAGQFRQRVLGTRGIALQEGVGQAFTVSEVSITRTPPARSVPKSSGATGVSTCNLERNSRAAHSR